MQVPRWRIRTVTTVTCFLFSSRRRHTRFDWDWSSDVCSSDLLAHVVDPSDEGADVGGARLRRDQALHAGEAQGDVRLDAVAGEPPHRDHPRSDHRALDHDFAGDLAGPFPLLHHPFAVNGNPPAEA